MTESELTVLRLQMRSLVRELALQVLVKSLKGTSGGEQHLCDWASRVRAEAAKQTVPKAGAAQSDLLAAEYQEALREMFDELGL